MSTETEPQTFPDAVETTGLSTATTTRTIEDQRLGTIYNADTFAAAISVWFHPLQTGRYLGVLAEYWRNATVVGAVGPQAYDDHDVVAVPSWITIEPASGHVTALGEIPTRLGGTRVLNGACSRGDFLYTVGTIDGDAHIAYHRVDVGGTKILQGEEVITPVGETEIVFDAGCYIDGRYLVVFGVDEAGSLYRIRKAWSRIGVTDSNEPWQVGGVKGWYDINEVFDEDTNPITGPTYLEPLRTSGGALLDATALNSITYAYFRDREYIAISREGVNTKFYSSRRVAAGWTFVGSVDSDLVYLQPQLPYNRSVMPEGVTAGIPYLSVETITTSGEESLDVAWDLWPI